MRILSLILALSGSLGAATHNVSSGNFFYSPNSVNINAGDTVQWSGLGSGHNVAQSADAGSDNYDGSGFRSGNTNSGVNTYSFQFNTPGTYFYVCENHAGANMKGQVVVAAVASPTSTPTVTPTRSPTPGPCVIGSSSADLFVNFSGLPATVLSGQVLTVVVVMSTGGGPGSYNTSAQLLAQPGSGVTADLLSAAVDIPNLGVGTSNRYTWTYSISGSGNLSFSATGSGSDAAICPCVYRESTDCSGSISVAVPTATASPSPTVTPTVSVTPSITWTFTITPTPTITHTFNASQLAEYNHFKPILGPVPAKVGDALCLQLSAKFASETGEIVLYNQVGERVSLQTVAQARACFETRSWAPGIYHARIKVGQQTRWQRLAITP